MDSGGAERTWFGQENRDGFRRFWDSGVYRLKHATETPEV